MRTKIQRGFAPFKSWLPRSIRSGIRAASTAAMAPVLFSSWSGHFKSSLRGKAVSQAGTPIPWYTYPCIHFLEFRDFRGKRILEFGGGQSTLWWAARAKHVITIEQDAAWHSHLASIIPGNVDLRLVASDPDHKGPVHEEMKTVFASIPGKLDVIVIDGIGDRKSLLEICWGKLAENGALICDDSHGYGFQETTKDWAVERVDFFGQQPAVVLPNCTSIFFRPGCFLFTPIWPIPDVAVSRRSDKERCGS